MLSELLYFAALQLVKVERVMSKLPVPLHKFKHLVKQSKFVSKLRTYLIILVILLIAFSAVLALHHLLFHQNEGAYQASKKITNSESLSITVASLHLEREKYKKIKARLSELKMHNALRFTAVDEGHASAQGRVQAEIVTNGGKSAKDNSFELNISNDTISQSHPRSTVSEDIKQKVSAWETQYQIQFNLEPH